MNLIETYFDIEIFKKDNKFFFKFKDSTEFFGPFDNINLCYEHYGTITTDGFGD